MHPFFKLMVDQPAVITDHVEAYASLAALELSGAVTQLRVRALKTAIALSCAAVASVLAGVAVMLWAVTPSDHLHAPWALWLAPGLPAVVAAWSWISAQTPDGAPAFSALRSQVRADIDMLHEVSP
ncbi:MAG: hypothetical protein K2Q07_05075 [Burkholderiaceae bacterium]|nr:hypothetical protein [Burkholderiaceae bacterium]